MATPLLLAHLSGVAGRLSQRVLLSSSFHPQVSGGCPQGFLTWMTLESSLGVTLSSTILWASERERRWRTQKDLDSHLVPGTVRTLCRNGRLQKGKCFCKHNNFPDNTSKRRNNFLDIDPDYGTISHITDPDYGTISHITDPDYGTIFHITDPDYGTTCWTMKQLSRYKSRLWINFPDNRSRLLNNFPDNRSNNFPDNK
ncbi:hypothetical protein CEXT_13531 [Caerostris extrusa]|uniref:Uncharacterized protein n=1 Tax=Caerostris extrusa TaxID=172846 RepID=A0AAV4YB20_CAEEX|nr:hypothetical protein CEXT_13531 [Caerostris extrusa]